MVNTIKQLSEKTINLIAAGEVVERPASVVKELVENSIDAGAKNITIFLESAGKNLITINDDGHGISKEDLIIATKRYATSKMASEDLFNIKSFGFRGEALSSIESISRLSISSQHIESSKAYELVISENSKEEINEIPNRKGTKIEVRDLFFSTPARLKFLKADRTELNACLEVIKRIALVHHNISFTCFSEGKQILKLSSYNEDEATFKRIQDVVGKDFINNSISFCEEIDGIQVGGYAGLPTYNRASSDQQFFFVNSRIIKDKLIAAAVKLAYQDFIPKGRYPGIIIILSIPNYMLDVNVHPTKAEVRFRDPNNLRNIIISCIKNSISSMGHGVLDQSEILISKAVTEEVDSKDFLTKSSIKPRFYDVESKITGNNNDLEEKKDSYYYKNASNLDMHNDFVIKPPYEEKKISEITDSKPLGYALTQIEKTYIISRTNDGIVILDQHAAHERLVYENLKKEFKDSKIRQQNLITPLKICLDSKRQDLLISQQDNLAKLGIIINKFGDNSIVVHSIPILISHCDIDQLIKDLADDITEMQNNYSLIAMEEKILETYACHNSIRAGRALSLEEMNEMLRQVESTAFSGQCNHGRPCYVKIKIQDIKKLLDR